MVAISVRECHSDGKVIRCMGCSVAEKALDTKRIAWLGKWLRAVSTGEVYDSADSSISRKDCTA
jgi:DNA-binding IclR family transcriptional regulator